jgi:putative CocE/NonD family hydrolase
MIRTEMIAMRDGIRLATDIFLPEGAGPWPVVMVRTPYGRRIDSHREVSKTVTTPRTRAEVAQAFHQEGYAVVYQDCRGRYDSEGTFTKSVNEADDGFDTCAWLVDQEWCDGRICTMGMSYESHVQTAMGAVGAPGLVAQALDSGGFSNAWAEGVRNGGAFELKQWTWAHQQAVASPESVADPVLKSALQMEDMREWFARMPWKRGHSPLRHHPDYENYLFEQWRHGAFDDFWKQPGLWAAGYFSGYSPVSAIHMGSWLDAFPTGQVENYVGLKSENKGSHQLIMGPWTHGDRSITRFGDVDFGPESSLDSWAGDWLRYRIEFFNSVVHGAPLATPRVKVFLMGGGSSNRTPDGAFDHGGHWIELSDWPAPETSFTRFYLRADGDLADTGPEEQETRISYTFDPDRPVPTTSHALTREPTVRGGFFDQVERPDMIGCEAPYFPLASRADVMVFQTPPLEQDICIVGPIEVRLWVSTDGPDTDFTAKLVDVAPRNDDFPHGFAIGLSDGICRLRYAEDPENPRLHELGELVEARITMMPTGNIFRKGHRLRIDISSSNFPKFDVNPNTGEPEGLALRRRKAVNTIHVGPDCPSHVILPVLPVEAIS